MNNSNYPAAATASIARWIRPARGSGMVTRAAGVAATARSSPGTGRQPSPGRERRSPGGMLQKLLRRGQATVEFALILPVFLLILAGSIEFGRTFWSYGLLLQAAQEGARQGAVLGSATSDTAITTTTQQTAAKGGLTLNTTDVVITATCSYTSSTSIAAANRTRGNVLTVQT